MDWLAQERWESASLPQPPYMLGLKTFAAMAAFFFVCVCFLEIQAEVLIFEQKSIYQLSHLSSLPVNFTSTFQSSGTSDSL